MCESLVSRAGKVSMPDRRRVQAYKWKDLGRMDDSDMEILGIPINITRKEMIQIVDEDPQPRSVKKSVKDKLKETEAFHHCTAASKSTHTKKKRRKSHASRNNERSRHEKRNTGSRSDCQKHLKYAHDMTSCNKTEYPMLSDPHKSVPLITQNKITTSLGIYNKAKKSDKVLRDLKIPNDVMVKTQESLQKILDVSEANLPPAPNLDSPLMMDDMGIGLVQVVQPSSPESRIPDPKPVTVIPAPKPVAVIPTYLDLRKEPAAITEERTEEHRNQARNFAPLNSSPELSPVSEVAEMMHSSFSHNTTFPGRDYFSDIRGSLLKQLHRQRQSSALKTQRKKHIPSRRHSSVRKNLNKEFERKSGSVQSSGLSVYSCGKQGDVVRRSDPIPKSRSPNKHPDPLKHHVIRGSSSSMTISRAPHTITASPSASHTRVNAFEECVQTLQDQPPVDIHVSVDDFFPRVETQMLPSEHSVDMLDSIRPSCSSSNDSLSYLDDHHLVGNIIPVSALIYPPHLDPALSLQEVDRRCIPAGKHRQHKMISLRKGKYQLCACGSDEDSPIYSFPLPPPPVLPPASPSLPKMFRQRMY